MAIRIASFIVRVTLAKAIQSLRVAGRKHSRLILFEQHPDGSSERRNIARVQTICVCVADSHHANSAFAQLLPSHVVAEANPRKRVDLEYYALGRYKSS